jgi:zinc/manganese transport system substrate-binding protein
MLPSMPRILLTLAAIAVLLAACGGSAEPAGDRPTVVVTTTVLGDLAREVAGDGAEVRQLLRPNSDPHDYEPRPDDVRAVAEATLVLASGGGLDEWIAEVVDQSGSDARLLDVGARLPIERAEDPHWWHDPRNAEAAVLAIRDALARIDPERRGAYARNAAAYARELRALDAELRACVAAVPAARRKLVTDHDAFGYFADRYGLDVVGTVIPSLTTQAQPSAGDLAELADTVRRERVATIFSEQSVNARLAEAIARETGAASDDSLYGDTLGPDDSDGATYVGMLRHNAAAVVRGLTNGRRGC